MAISKASDFIPAGCDLSGSDELCARLANMSAEGLAARWSSPKGKEILDAWEKSGFDRTALDALVGKYLGQTDLRGVSLRKKDLQGKDLKHVDFYGADLSGCKLDGSDLSDSWLSHANLCGTSLNFCSLDRALVDGVAFDGGTSFLGVNQSVVNFNLAARLQASALRQAWIADIESNSPKTAFLLRVTCDYGRSFSRFALWAVAVVLSFACFYYLAPCAVDKQGFLNSLYFSVVTFTTLGYGDIHPVSILGIVAVIVEVILGYLMLGLLVAIISKKVLGS